MDRAFDVVILVVILTTALFGVRAVYAVAELLIGG